MAARTVLDTLDLAALTRLGAAIRRDASGAPSTEAAGRATVRILHDELVDRYGEPAIVLARTYVTAARRELPADVDGWLSKGHGQVAPGTTCFTLLATIGQQPEWCDRRNSMDHRAIPLPSPEAVSRLPMVARLFAELGLPARHVTAGGTGPVSSNRSLDVFHVREAAGSTHIPDQHRFVEPHGVRSVIGYGGTLPGQRLFCVILFTRVPIPRQRAELFRYLSESTGDVLGRSAELPLFDPET